MLQLHLQLQSSRTSPTTPSFIFIFVHTLCYMWAKTNVARNRFSPETGKNPFRASFQRLFQLALFRIIGSGFAIVLCFFFFFGEGLSKRCENMSQHLLHIFGSIFYCNGRLDCARLCISRAPPTWSEILSQLLATALPWENRTHIPKVPSPSPLWLPSSSAIDTSVSFN